MPGNRNRTPETVGITVCGLTGIIECTLFIMALVKFFSEIEFDNVTGGNWDNLQDNAKSGLDSAEPYLISGPVLLLVSCCALAMLWGYGNYRNFQEETVPHSRRRLTSGVFPAQRDSTRDWGSNLEMGVVASRDRFNAQPVPVQRDLAGTKSQASSIVQGALYGYYDNLLRLPKATAHTLITVLCETANVSAEDRLDTLFTIIDPVYYPLVPGLSKDFATIYGALSSIQNSLTSRFPAQTSIYTNGFMMELIKDNLNTLVDEHAKSVLKLPYDMAQSLIHYVGTKEDIAKADIEKHVQDNYAARLPTLKLNTTNLIEELKLINGLALNVDVWINHYNNERTHQGKMCCGRTPMQTFLDEKHIWMSKVDNLNLIVQ